MGKLRESLMTKKTKTAEPEASPMIETIGLDDVASELDEHSSEPSETFVAQNEQRKANEESEYAHLRDKQGYTFDPAIHLTDSEGKPRFNVDDTLKRRRKRKAKTDASAKVSEAASVQLTAEQQQQARYAGIAAANSMLVVCRGLGGDDWQPIKNESTGIDEQAELAQAFGDYFVSKGWTEFPPGIALSLCVGMYATPRFTLPKTQSRIKNGWARVTGWFSKRKRKRVAQPNNRNDREREINTRKDAGNSGGDAPGAEA